MAISCGNIYLIVFNSIHPASRITNKDTKYIATKLKYTLLAGIRHSVRERVTYRPLVIDIPVNMVSLKWIILGIQLFCKIYKPKRKAGKKL